MSQRLPATARREQILAVALDVFASSGFHGASMNDIAEAAGVTKPVLYQHFDSKRDLYQALLEDVGTRLLESIAKATAEATDGKSTTALGFQAYFRWVADDHDAFRLLFGAGTASDDEFSAVIKRVNSEAAAAIAPLIDADLDDDTRRTLASALVGLAEGASRQLVLKGRDFDPDRIAREVSGLAWAGLRALQPTT
ncbi:MAG: TetR/AcrR family transcriptional regulator [Actinomycetota bacterium]